MNTLKNRTLYYCLILLLLSSCGKEFLDINRDKSQVIPAKISDYQALIDLSTTLNVSSSHELGVIGADEFRISDSRWDLLADPYQKNGYIWAKNVYEGKDVGDWNNAYKRILYANLVLDGLNKIKPGTAELNAWNKASGAALFYRALNFYQLAQLFCKPYNKQTAGTDMGIPLRLEADITTRTIRSSVEETYLQILSDLHLAVKQLPDKAALVYQPSKAAAYALLAKTSLLMENYEAAGNFSNLCLQIRLQLIDFNTLDSNARYPFTGDYEKNPEIIFYTNMNGLSITAITRLEVAPDIVKQYEEGDLRRPLFFHTQSDKRKVFKGSYMASSSFFTGLAVDEVLLIRAEASARRGVLADTKDDLNLLRKNRFKPDNYKAVNPASPEDALKLVIAERRKELIFRGLRWEDLRRLNNSVMFAKEIVRKINGTDYVLSPGDPRYVWPIPDDVIRLSGIPQNER